MTIFLGSLLSFTRMQLGPIQKKQVEIDTKKKILGAVMDISSLSPEEVLELYNEKMNSKKYNDKVKYLGIIPIEDVYTLNANCIALYLTNA